jgi:uncharacterized protein YbcI
MLRLLNQTSQLMINVKRGNFQIEDLRAEIADSTKAKREKETLKGVYGSQISALNGYIHEVSYLFWLQHHFLLKF